MIKYCFTSMKHVLENVFKEDYIKPSFFMGYLGENMAKKKIGLAVCYDTKNFGSQLQVLATDKKINELGYDTEIIRYKKKLTPVFAIQTIPRFFNPYFVKGKIENKKRKSQLIKNPDIYQNVQTRNKCFDKFVEEHFTNLSKKYVGWEKLRKASSDYDAFLCGSDQLWLPQNLGSHFYTLEFVADNKPKIAYATSFGVSAIPWFQKKRTKRYLDRFMALSTRELKGQKIIENLTGKKADVVCDPTLLFDAEGWSKVIEDRKVVEEPYVFCYFLGKNVEHRKIASEFAAVKNLKNVSCPFLDNYVEADVSFGDVQMYDLDAADFVNLIRHAEYILTDSFHGTVFSILHHKQFITFNRFGNEAGSRNSRIDSLFELLHLEDRRYAGDVVNKASEHIDYDTTDRLLKTIREESIHYLNNSLSLV